MGSAAGSVWPLNAPRRSPRAVVLLRRTVLTSGAVQFKQVDVVFGSNPKAALPLLDRGAERDAILEQSGQVAGVRDASLAVDQGQICVLVGLSGSGKSTLLRCVNGLNRPTRGAVLVQDGDGHVDVASCGTKTLRRLRLSRVTMVFQHFALLPWRTVADNVGFGLEIRGIAKAERERIVTEKLQLVHLEQCKDKYAHELSGGMQQRVGLARAFATDADIMLMDEPFSALDPPIREHLQDELLALQQRLHKTIIFISQDLDEALKLGFNIAIMKGGRIVQTGRPEDIVLNPVDDYVAEFVAHMNPLNVLRGASLMTPVQFIRRDGEALLLDRAGHTRLSLDPDGAPATVTVDGSRGRLVAFSGPGGGKDDKSRFGRHDIVTAAPEITMRTAMEIRHRTGRPVALVADGKMVGVIGDDELYRGILRQTSIADDRHTDDDA